MSMNMKIHALAGLTIIFNLFSIIGDASAQSDQPGGCRVNHYWQQGRCLDACNKQKNAHYISAPGDMAWNIWLLKYGSWHQ